MADVAQLGIAVDSSQAKSATGDLKGLAAAANSAEQASARLSAAGQKSETVLRSMDAAAKRAGVSTEEMRSRTEAFNATTTKMAGSSMTAQKALVSLSTQAVKTANDNQELGKKTEATTSTLEKFATRFTRGLIAGTAVAGLREVIQYIFQLNSQLATTADTAQRVGVGGQQFQGLQTAAAYKGINNDAFNSAMLAFNAQIDLAKHGLGDLQTLLRSNGKVASDTATTFGVVADLVKNAGSEAQKFSILQQAGLPATREFAKLMEQGADSITRQSLAAAKLRDQQLEDAQRLDERWQKLWVDFANWGKKAALDVGEGIKNIPTPFAHQGTWLGAKLQGMGFDRPEDPNSPRNQGLDMLRRGMGSQLGANAATGIYNATGAFGTAPTNNKPTFDPNLARQQIALEQQRLSLLGPLATAEDVVRAKQLEINAAALNNVGISKQQADNLKLIALAQFEQYRVQQQASIGVFDFAKAQKAANDNLQALVAQKLLDPNNPQQWAAANNVAARSLQELADAASVAGSKLPGLQQAINDASNFNKQLDQFASSSFGSITTGLTDIFDGTKSAATGFADLSKTAIRSLEEMLVKAYIVAPLFKALTGGLSGIGGMFGFSDGGFVAPKGFAAGGYTGAGSKYQPAGVVHAGEFVFSQAATNRIGVGNLERIHRGYAEGGFVQPAANSNVGSGPISLVINNNGQPVQVSDVQQTVDGRGQTKVSVTLDQAVGAAMSRQGSDTRKALQANFGARPIGVRR